MTAAAPEASAAEVDIEGEMLAALQEQDDVADETAAELGRVDDGEGSEEEDHEEEEEEEGHEEDEEEEEDPGDAVLRELNGDEQSELNSSDMEGTAPSDDEPPPTATGPVQSSPPPVESSAEIGTDEWLVLKQWATSLLDKADDMAEGTTRALEVAHRIGGAFPEVLAVVMTKVHEARERTAPEAAPIAAAPIAAASTAAASTAPAQVLAPSDAVLIGKARLDGTGVTVLEECRRYDISREYCVGEFPTALLEEGAVRGKLWIAVRLTLPADATMANLQNLAVANALATTYVLVAERKVVWLYMKCVAEQKYRNKALVVPESLGACSQVAYGFIKEAGWRPVVSTVTTGLLAAKLVLGTLSTRLVSDEDEILPFRVACDAVEHYTEEKWREAKSEACRLEKLRRHTPLSAAISCMTQGMNDYLKDKWTSVACVKRLEPLAGEPAYPEYDTDTTAACRALVGRRWLPESGEFKEITLHEHQNSKERMLSSLLLAGPSALGKSTLLHMLAKEACMRRDRDVYAWSKAVDPFGLLTKAGMMKKFGAVCLTDFPMMSCLNTQLDADAMKSLFDVREGGDCPARYHPATWEKRTQKLFAVNYDWPVGPLLADSWMSSNRCSWMHHVIQGDVAMMRQHGQDIQAVAARVTIFGVPAGTSLVTPTGIRVMAEDDEAEFAAQEAIMMRKKQIRRAAA